MKETTDIHWVFARHIADDKMLRAAAYATSKKLEDGHICVDIPEYNKVVNRDTDSKYGERNPFLETDQTIDARFLKKHPLVSADAQTLQPFVLSNDKLYLQRYYQYEHDIIQNIQRLSGFDNEAEALMTSEKDGTIKTLIDTLFHTDGKDESKGMDWQMVATIQAIRNNFMIITGGPGTGKTTTVARILAILFKLKPDLSVALAAPTGKAAARLNESLTKAKDIFPSIDKEIRDKFDLIKASTLHRLLGARWNSPYFKHNKDNPLPYDLIIIDESSMIDALLMAKLLDAVPTQSKVIFLGDKDQLASVEAGSIFGDLCLTQNQMMNLFSEATINHINGLIGSGAAKVNDGFRLKGAGNLLSEKIIELKKSYRFKEEKGIGKLSKSIISGKTENLDEFKKPTKEGVTIVNSFNFEKPSENVLFNERIAIFERYIREADINKALQLVNDIRVLCAVNEGKYGVGNFNKIVETYLKNKKLIDPSTNFYHNQPIIVSRNDYHLGLFNGDVGIIRKDEEGVLKAYFEGIDETGHPSLKEVLPGYISEFRTVYAMTIHKSQGSEFEQVIIVLPDEEHVPILTRELLYTAVTRAKQHALVIAKDEIIKYAVEKKVSRASGIRWQIENLNTSP